jgi:hypothetical protein
MQMLKVVPVFLMMISAAAVAQQSRQGDSQNRNSSAKSGSAVAAGPAQPVPPARPGPVVAEPYRPLPPPPVVYRPEPQRPHYPPRRPLPPPPVYYPPVYYPPPPPPPPQGPQRSIVTCSSEGGRMARCYVGRAYVRFLERISSAACTANVNWGYDRRAGQIWVTDGCRARFEVTGGDNGDNSQVIVCESIGGREKSCGGNFGFIYGVDIENQLSSSPCDYNVSWGYDSRYVWVKNGCRATFRVYN